MEQIKFIGLNSNCVYLILILSLFSWTNKICAQKEVFHIPIKDSDNSIIVIDSSFEYTYRYREDTPLQTKIGTRSKIYLAGGGNLEFIDSINGGIYEIVSVYLDKQPQGIFQHSFAILYKGSPTTSVYFRSYNRLKDGITICATNSANKRFSWINTLRSRYSRFSRFHKYEYRDHQIDSIEWFNSKMFKVFYEPLRNQIGIKHDSTTGDKIKIWKVRRPPIEPRMYAEISGELRFLRDYKEYITERKNLLSAASLRRKDD